MRALITGATGYIGQQLALELANRDYAVHALVRDPESDSIPKHKNIILFKGDICNPDTVQKAVANCEYVFHTAAFTDMKCNKIDNFYTTNVVGTSNVLQASLDHRVKKVIFTSSLAVFGPALYQVPITEDQPRLESFSNDYELTKKMAEDEVSKYVKKGLNCSILNVSRVYGPGKKTFSNGVNTLISKIMSKKVLYVPSRLNVEANYVYIEDVVNAQILVAEKGQPGENYIIGGENINYKGLFRKIKALTNSNVRIKTVNYQLVRSVLGFLSNLNQLIGLTPKLTPKVLDSLFTNRSATSKKAISVLNYKITPLNKGLARTINHLN